MPVIIQSRNSHSVTLSIVFRIPIAAFTKVSSRSSYRTSRDIDLKSPMCGVLTRRISCAPMSLSAVYSVVTGCLKQVDKRRSAIRIALSFHSTNAVIVPIWQSQRLSLRSVDTFFSNVQLVTLWRAALLPVIKLQRLGELIGHA